MDIALHSMTGFARTSGEAEGWSWAWEVKSVNGRSLEMRLRLPGGFEALEPQVRSQAQARLARGSVNAALTVTPASNDGALALNRALLKSYAEAALELAETYGLPKPGPAELLALKGVVEGEPALDEDARAVLHAAILDSFGQALESLRAHRAVEGEKIATLLTTLLDRIAILHGEAEVAAGEQPRMIRERLEAQIESLLAGEKRVDPDRVAQEVALIAVKADVREELDRLKAHIEQARGLMKAGGPVGRKFDFLAQELNREATTLCNKAATVDLNRVGLDLKATIDQLREQIQNIE